MIRWTVVLAGILGFVGVLLGAFGAHGLPDRLAAQGFDEVEVAKKVDQLEIGVRYQMFHVLAILAIGLLGGEASSTKRRLATGFFLAGSALFSGGLYSMALLDVMGHWAIVPLGGLCFMIGWVIVVMLGTDMRPTITGSEAS